MTTMVSGFEYNVQTINYCEGTIKVTDRTHRTNDYSLKDCSLNDRIWECSCNSLPKDIILQYAVEKETIYDFIIEYYVGDNSNEDNKRIYSYEGLKVVGIKPKQIFEFPKIAKSELNSIIIIVILIGILSILGLGLFLKNLFTVKDEEVEEEYKEEEIVVDDDVYAIMDKYDR